MDQRRPTSSIAPGSCRSLLSRPSAPIPTPGFLACSYFHSFEATAWPHAWCRSRISVAGRGYCRGNGDARLSVAECCELVRSAERGPEDTAATVSVMPTFFRAEITGSKGLLATWGAPPVCRPGLTIHDHTRTIELSKEKKQRHRTRSQELRARITYS